MSKKCKEYGASKLAFAPHDNRKAFYAGWDAAMAQHQPRKPMNDEEISSLISTSPPSFAVEIVRIIERAHGIGSEE